MERLDELVDEVRRGARYREISPEVVRRIATAELEKGRGYKEAVKATRNKLHQVGGAYQETPIPYPRLLAELEFLPANPANPELQAFCRKALALHASTRERLPILERFYAEILAPLAPITSALDVACGLNPLALPWLPLAEGAPYYASDIYADLVDFDAAFLRHVGRPGGCELYDLLQGPPLRRVQLALALKTIPCLEQVDKQIGLRLLEGLQADYVLFSFPAASLGGRGKGMLQNYAAHFAELVAGKSWSVKRFEFPGELAFLVKKL